MWVKTDKGYMQDPTFIGEGWILRCNEIDGSVFVIKANRNPSPTTVYRNMRKVIRVHSLPIKMEGDIIYSRSFFNGLAKSAEVEVTWVSKPMIVNDIRCSQTVLIEREHDETINAENH